MAQIQDYGDKVGGARKDEFEGYLLRLSTQISEDPESMRALSLSDAFPKPNYVSLAERGVSKTCLAAICAARGAIDRKPVGRFATPRKMLLWIAQINLGKQIALQALNFDGQGDALDQRISETMSRHTETVRLTFRTLIDVPSENLNGGEALTVQRYRGDLVLANQGRKILARHPDTPGSEDAAHARMVRGVIDNSEKTIAAPKRRTLEDRAGDLAKKVKLYGTRTDLSIELRTMGGRLVFKTGMNSVKAAREWYAGNGAEIKQKILATMGEKTERTGTYRDRKGPARRAGNISAEAFAQRFGLRAVEFGNYVENNRRARDLNDMNDGLADLAAAIGVPERLIGYNGALAVAFGARGNGHAAAHYERDRRVFNLTKTAGSGSGSHEWFHSADNAAAMFDSSDKNERTMSMMSCGDSAAATALRQAWKGYEARMSALDAGKARPYWSKPEELSARCFETWLVEKLADLDIINDHLVDLDLSSDVYPTDEEMTVIRPAMDRFIKEMTDKLLMDAGMERGAAPDRQVEAAPIATREMPAVVAAIPTSIDDFDEREPEFDF